ncbi:hypothetical protein D6C99_05128 [Aureobasidium pullulans]|uniref:Uncharacterized protein n=1 Tax=Aureobasidium pullulans TaxID=5580 RepID=A0A4S9N1Y9_AURPU|nr:hypothetical protein D6D15_02944 [Aureobasidium pullulans]THY49444.1 hypothetical protein D6C99_05128 [Aureobasidium pullulans]
MLFVQCGSCVRPCVLEVFPSSAMTAVIGGDIQPSFSRILMSLITCILPSRSWRAIEYSTITQCLATRDVKVIGSLCGGLPLSFPMQHHLRSCLFAYNGPLTRPTYRAVRHVVSIIDRVLVVALSSVVEGEHDRAVLAAKSGLLAAEAWSIKEEAVRIGDGTL